MTNSSPDSAARTALLKAVTTAEDALRTLRLSLEAPAKAELNPPSKPASNTGKSPPIPRRRGLPANTETDPALQAIIGARIADMPLKSLAEAIRSTFGPRPGASLSGLHRSWRRHGHRLTKTPSR